jgi:CPA2 family monovalent cation:H+ antiporter-2
MFGHSPRTALTIAASLAQIGEFAFILAGLGMALDLLPQAGQNLVLAGAILSIMLNPVLFTLLEKYLDKTETLEEQTWKRPLRKRSRSRSIFATTRCWSALAASAACWARS